MPECAAVCSNFFGNFGVNRRVDTVVAGANLPAIIYRYCFDSGSMGSAIIFSALAVVLGDGGDDGNWRVDLCDVYLAGAIAVVHTLLSSINCADCSGSVDYRWVAGAEPLFAVC